MKFRLREFPFLEAEYLVCGTCNRAQKRPSGLKTRARGRRAADRERIRKALAVSAESCKFKILVWGPDSASGNPAAAVREDIRGELRRFGHDAFFSEELTIKGIPANVQELLQLEHVNLVIDVAASFGSLAEFENYGVMLGERLLVFLNDAAKGGFTDMGARTAFRAGGGTAEFFNDKDLESGVLVLAALDWVALKAYLQKWKLGVIEKMQKSLL